MTVLLTFTTFISTLLTFKASTNFHGFFYWLLRLIYSLDWPLLVYAEFYRMSTNLIVFTWLNWAKIISTYLVRCSPPCCSTKPPEKARFTSGLSGRSVSTIKQGFSNYNHGWEGLFQHGQTYADRRQPEPSWHAQDWEHRWKNYTGGTGQYEISAFMRWDQFWKSHLHIV